MKQIFLIRHAEKPIDEAAPSPHAGVNAAGAQDNDSLTVRGWQRAGALAVFFGPGGKLQQPNRIYASAAEKLKTHEGKFGSKSRRPTETVTPLADKLGMTLIDKFTKDQEAELAKELKTLDGTTLVCWQHEMIPTIAKELLGTDKGVPDSWPPDRFDVVWRFVDNGSGTLIFDQICQDVLKGDSLKTIPV